MFVLALARHLSLIPHACGNNIFIPTVGEKKGRGGLSGSTCKKSHYFNPERTRKLPRGVRKIATALEGLYRIRYRHARKVGILYERRICIGVSDSGHRRTEPICLATQLEHNLDKTLLFQHYNTTHVSATARRGTCWQTATTGDDIIATAITST